VSDEQQREARGMNTRKQFLVAIERRSEFDNGAGPRL
jgi:hypothetical protein